MPLTLLAPGARARVTLVSGGRMFNQRLAAMGILPGAYVKVVRPNFGGPVLVDVLGTRVALGRGMAQRVHARPLRC